MYYNYLSAAPPSSPQSLAITDTVYGINDFTVSVEWESPASDGGVGIDSYTLTGAGITAPLTVLSNEPLMATLTLSYNEMHMLSITASNCAGESTASLVTIREGESVSRSYYCVASASGIMQYQFFRKAFLYYATTRRFQSVIYRLHYQCLLSAMTKL